MTILIRILSRSHQNYLKNHWDIFRICTTFGVCHYFWCRCKLQSNWAKILELDGRLLNFGYWVSNHFLALVDTFFFFFFKEIPSWYLIVLIEISLYFKLIRIIETKHTSWRCHLSSFVSSLTKSNSTSYSYKTKLISNWSFINLKSHI